MLFSWLPEMGKTLHVRCVCHQSLKHTAEEHLNKIHNLLQIRDSTIITVHAQQARLVWIWKCTGLNVLVCS